MTTKKAASSTKVPAAQAKSEEAGPSDWDAQDGPGTPTDSSSSSDADTTSAAGGARDTVDVVTFTIDGEIYAFPMEQVKEIIRMPQMVRVPLGPPSLQGLTNLRGRVLPIVSLRACCGLPAVEHDESTRVIVVEAGATLGFVVDRVASVSSVDAGQVEAADELGGTIDSQLLTGVIRSAETGGELTKLLDIPQLMSSQFTLLREDAATRAGTDALSRDVIAREDAGEDGDDDNTLELVSFAVDGQEYALPIQLVQEIVQAPERITTVPNVAARVLGVMDLRGRLLPVVSLRQVFGLPQAPLEPQNRIVVVQLPGAAPDGGSVVGVVLDTVREVLRVPRELVAALPEYMAQSGRAHEVESVCRLEQGQRLVSVLSVERIFARDDLQSALREVAAENSPLTGIDEQELAVADRREHQGDDELLVVFQLDDEEYSVDVDAVQEIIRVPESLIRVPKTLDFVEGLVNLRGAVLPVVDLRSRLGLTRSERDERQRIIVLIVSGQRTGFIVDSVTEVLRVSRDDLEPAPELSREQSHLVSRVANLAGSQRMLMMLETDHLIDADQLDALIPQQRDAAEVLVG